MDLNGIIAAVASFTICAQASRPSWGLEDVARGEMCGSTSSNPTAETGPASFLKASPERMRDNLRLCTCGKGACGVSASRISGVRSASSVSPAPGALDL